MRRSAAVLIVQCVCVAAFGAACERTRAAEVLQITELAPRAVEAGDRLQIVAQEYPAAADIRRISVTFRGTLARPGRSACRTPTEVTLHDPPLDATVIDSATGQLRDATYAEEGIRSLRLEAPTRLDLLMSDALIAQLSRCAEAPAEPEMDVPHATLSLSGAGVQGGGGMTVAIEGLTGGHTIAGTLRGTWLDLAAPPARRLALEAPAREAAQHALDFLGITLASSHPDDGGLRVASVLPGRPAEQAGIAPNDVIARMDGLAVMSLADLAPAPNARVATMEVRRGDVIEDRVVSLAGLTPRASFDLVFALVALLAFALFVLASLAPHPAALAWARHRITRAWTAPRPSRDRREARQLASLGVPLAIARHGALAVGSVASACIALVGLSADALSHARIDLLNAFFLAQLLVIVGRSLDVRRGMRATLTRILVPALVALPAAVAVSCVLFAAGTLQARSVALMQGGMPWEWNVFRTPAATMLFALYVLVTLDRGSLARGPATNRRMLAADALEMCGVTASVAIGVVLFLGAWRSPVPGATVGAQMVGAALFAIKSCLWLVGALWFRARTPSVTMGILMRRCVPFIACATSIAGALHIGATWFTQRLDPVVGSAAAATTFVACTAAIVSSFANSRRASGGLPEIRVAASPRVP